MDQELFLKKLASDEPAPGGGTASAVAGSMGAALLAMVAKLSVKTSPSANEISREAEMLMDACSHLAQEDEKAFEAVVTSYKLPKANEEDKLIRMHKIEEALKTATEVPLKSAKTSLRILNLALNFLPTANKNAISDLGVAALLANAAVEGALLNVIINLASIKDKAFVNHYLAEAETLMKQSQNITHDITKSVHETLKASLKVL